MTIVIITKQPRSDWNGLNTKRFNNVPKFTFDNNIITLQGVYFDSEGQLVQSVYNTNEITSITITY